MFFNRNKQQEPAAATGLTDGVEANVATFIKNWGDLQRGLKDAIVDGQGHPLQLLTDADVAYFVQAMDAEVAQIEREVADIKKRQLAEIAQKDAEIAAINREIEARKALIADQERDIVRRVDDRAALLDIVQRLAPGLDTSKLSDHEIRCAVVRRKFGDEAVVGKVEAYVEARFDAIAHLEKVDPFARVVADGLTPSSSGKGAADKAYEDMVRELSDAHRTTH